MDDFSIPGASNYFGLAPSPINFPEPGKRPLSSMSPSMLFDTNTGQLRLVGGASGGSRIITATAQMILNVIGRGMDLLSAIKSPRIHAQLLPNPVYVEHHNLITGLDIIVDDRIIADLKNRHHNVSIVYNAGVGVTQFISIDVDSGLRTAVSDPRKYGTPSG